MLALPSTFIQVATLVAALVCLLAGAAAIWTNPQRLANRALFGSASITTIWLLCVYQVMKAGDILQAKKYADMIFWLRTSSVVAALLPFCLWFVTQAILSNGRAKTALWKSMPWLGIGGVLIYLCYTESFIVSTPSTFIQVDGLPYYSRGTSYYIYICLCQVAYVFGGTQMIRAARAESGIRRIEILFLGLTLGATTAAMCILNMLGHLLHIRELNRVSIFFCPAGHLFAAWALAYHRIFEGRELVLSLCQRLGMLLSISTGAWAISALLPKSMLSESRLFISCLIVGSVTLILEHRFRSIFKGDEQKRFHDGRYNIIAAARRDADINVLTNTFRSIMIEQCDAAQVDLSHSENRKSLIDRPILNAFDLARPNWREFGWISPESLERLRTPAAKIALDYFEKREVGLVVVVARETGDPSLMITFGLKRNRWPFSYPEIQRVLKLAEMMDNVLAHTRLVSQTMLKTRMEHLALFSRGLAHDLKNLITPVSSFLVHAERNFPLNEVEAEVHATATRSLRIISDYIRESLSFADHLQPKFELSAIESIIAMARDVTASRAHHRRVHVTFIAVKAPPFIADEVLLKRMLVNLVNNAIDASPADSNVLIEAQFTRSRTLQFIVTDQGTGIAKEHLERIFEPYFTTKEYGDQVRGFGLGLTIAEKIARLHGGRIEIKSELGQGTTVIVCLPVVESLWRVGTPKEAADLLSTSATPDPV